MEKNKKDCEGNCPKCNSENIEYDGVEIEWGDGVAWNEYLCLDCGDKGREHYDLTYWGSISNEDSN